MSKKKKKWVWWYNCVIPRLGKQRTGIPETHWPGRQPSTLINLRSQGKTLFQTSEWMACEEWHSRFTSNLLRYTYIDNHTRGEVWREERRGGEWGRGFIKLFHVSSKFWPALTMTLSVSPFLLNTKRDMTRQITCVSLRCLPNTYTS